ncbi:MAG: hypothetical protein ACRDLT_05270 [Solirubrobacteraceae bacterium]
MLDVGLRLVMVGGIAATIHGAKRATKDLDICPAWDRENLGAPHRGAA